MVRNYIQWMIGESNIVKVVLVSAAELSSFTYQGSEVKSIFPISVIEAWLTYKGENAEEFSKLSRNGERDQRPVPAIQRAVAL